MGSSRALRRTSCLASLSWRPRTMMDTRPPSLAPLAVRPALQHSSLKSVTSHQQTA